MLGRTELENVPLFDLDKPCETSLTECPNRATCAVWCDHHVQGCDYTGFRCDVHLNLLRLEVQRNVDAIHAGRECLCARCGERVAGTDISDHLRWVRL